MHITFPHMGTLHLTLSTLFQQLGLEVIPPPLTTKETMVLGTQHAPEFACMPLKLMLGNFIQAIAQGADTIVMCGGCGPCRLGYYAQVQQELLKDLGYDIQMIVLEADIFELIPRIRQLAPGKSWQEIYRATQVAWEKMKAIDEVERLSHRLRPRALQSQEVTRIYEHSLGKFSNAHTLETINSTREQAIRDLSGIQVTNRNDLLKVGIVGELFVALEPMVNQELEKHLGDMGVQVERTIYITDWVKSHLAWNREARARRKAVAASARPYLNHWVGGHGLETIGRTIQLAGEGYDGVIQLFPFTCMPEIVAKSILSQVSRDYEIPVMTLVLDEHAGVEGLMTRIEAFIDLITRRRNREGFYEHLSRG